MYVCMRNSVVPEEIRPLVFLSGGLFPAEQRQRQREKKSLSRCAKQRFSELPLLEIVLHTNTQLLQWADPHLWASDIVTRKQKYAEALCTVAHKPCITPTLSEFFFFSLTRCSLPAAPLYSSFRNVGLLRRSASSFSYTNPVWGIRPRIHVKKSTLIRRQGITLLCFFS